MTTTTTTMKNWTATSRDLQFSLRRERSERFQALASLAA
jgi:hypothetical protein